MVKILIVEDQTFMRESLIKLIEQEENFEVVCGISKASMALEMCKRHKPDMVILDVCTENNESGIAAAGSIRNEFPSMKIVIMTGLPEISFVEGAKKAGANSFIYKNASSKDLISILNSTLRGFDCFPGKGGTENKIDYNFTDIELKVLKLTCEGMSRKEIADTLFVSEGTVKHVISSILTKTGFKGILQFAVYAVSNGYIMPSSNSFSR